VHSGVTVFACGTIAVQIGMVPLVDSGVDVDSQSSEV